MATITDGKRTPELGLEFAANPELDRLPWQAIRYRTLSHPRAGNPRPARVDWTQDRHPRSVELGSATVSRFFFRKTSSVSSVRPLCGEHRRSRPPTRAGLLHVTTGGLPVMITRDPRLAARIIIQSPRIDSGRPRRTSHKNGSFCLQVELAPDLLHALRPW